MEMSGKVSRRETGGRLRSKYLLHTHTNVTLKNYSWQVCDWKIKTWKEERLRTIYRRHFQDCPNCILSSCRKQEPIVGAGSLEIVHTAYTFLLFHQLLPHLVHPVWHMLSKQPFLSPNLNSKSSTHKSERLKNQVATLFIKTELWPAILT